MAQALEDWYKQMPIITRSYLAAAIVTTIGCYFEIISPHHLYLNTKLVAEQYQIWRLVTNFLYFRNMDLDFNTLSPLHLCYILRLIDADASCPLCFVLFDEDASPHRCCCYNWFLFDGDASCPLCLLWVIEEARRLLSCTCSHHIQTLEIMHQTYLHLLLPITCACSDLLCVVKNCKSDHLMPGETRN